MNVKKFISDHLNSSAEVKQKMINTCSQAISASAQEIVGCFGHKGKVLICGNGGSAADAQHIAAEFVIRLSHDLMRPALPVISLATDSSIMTAGGNDIGFDNVFSRQVEALGNKGDILIAISTSGNSENILRAIRTAKDKKMRIIGFLGKQGGRAKEHCHISLQIPADNTQHIQEGHITAGHIICELVEQTLFGS